jgi:hypothetical protein
MQNESVLATEEASYINYNDNWTTTSNCPVTRYLEVKPFVHN